MAKKPYKYRQARKDAKAAAKRAFPGKVKAVRKDITGKITAEDRLALKDMADTAKKELGKKAYLSRAEYDAMQNRELEKFRESMREEFGEYAGKKAGEAEAPAKKAPAKKAAVKKAAAALEKKAPVKKAAVKKAAVKPTKTFGEISKSVTAAKEPVKKAAPSKTMTRAEKSAANKAAWKNMTPAERKNWSANKPAASAVPAKDSGLRKSLGISTDKWSKMTQAEKEAAVKKSANAAGAKERTRMAEAEAKVKARQEARAATTKRPTLADLKRNEAKGLEEAKARVAAKNKALADSAKGKTQTPQAVEAKKKAAAKPEGKAPAKTGGKNVKPKFRKIKAAGKGGVYGAVAGELVSLAKGSTKKDFDEINRLENKLAQITGKGKSKATAGRQGAQQQLSQLASLASLGVVGKTRRQRMDELNALIAKAEKKNKPKELRYGKDGSSLVPGTAAYKAGSKTRPTVASTGGGSTTKVSDKYTVKKGDTFSGIAKTAGLSLSELRAANPDIMKKKKYKQGSMIWSGTKVNIPKKK
jgi:LysM repeat protein